MPKPICTDCQTEMRIAKNGAYLLEMFSAPPRPYKIWFADVWQCKGCGRKIISGFGNNPLAEHFESEFQDFLDMVKNSDEAKEGWLFYAYENSIPKGST